VEAQMQKLVNLRYENIGKLDSMVIEVVDEKQALESVKMDGVIGFQTGTAPVENGETNIEKAKFDPWNLVGTLYTPDEFKKLKEFKESIGAIHAYNISIYNIKEDDCLVIVNRGNVWVPVTKKDKVKVYNENGELSRDFTDSAKQNRTALKHELN